MPRNDEYLHRRGAGRGSISANDPIEARIYAAPGQPVSESNPLEVRVRHLEVELQQLRDLLQSGDARVTAFGGHAIEPHEGRGDAILTFSNPVSGFTISNDSLEYDLYFTFGDVSGPFNLPLHSSSLWEPGSISSETGQPTNPANRIRTIDYFSLPANITLLFTWSIPNATMALIEYDDNNRFIRGTGLRSSPVIVHTHPRTVKAKMVFAVQGSDPSVMDSSDLIVQTLYAFPVRPGEVFEDTFPPFEMVYVFSLGPFRAYGRR